MKIVQFDVTLKKPLGVIVAGNITNKTLGEIMVLILNNYSVHWYKLVEDDFQTWRSIGELVAQDFCEICRSPNKCCLLD